MRGDAVACAWAFAWVSLCLLVSFTWGCFTLSLNLPGFLFLSPVLLDRC